MTSNETSQRKHTKILIIHTGGTLGMLPNNETPAPGYLAKQLEGLYRFNDPNAQKIEGFKFATPVSKYNTVGYYNILELDPLKNSVNMSFEDWNKIANCIKENYEKYDAFIIIHGTDTMCFTASALSFMLENLHKTVIVTGSLLPISKIMSDGTDNLLGALDIAMHFVIPEVCIYSYTKLFRANRTTKVNTVGFKIFKSPNFPPLGEIGIDLSIEWSLLRGCNSDKPLIVHPITNPNVGCIQLFPGITKDVIKNFLREPMAGIILQTYGAGNVPYHRTELFEVLKEATDRGVIIVNITPCYRGGINMEDSTKKVLEEAGVISGEDMTMEAALTKLMYLLSRKDLSKDDVKRLMQKNIRGELTSREHKKTLLTQVRKLFVQSVANALLGDANREDLGAIDNELLPVMICSWAGLGELEALKAMKDVNFASISDHNGRTPLHVAASEGHFKIVKFLVENGVDVNAADNFGVTPLREAIRKQNDEIAKYLKSHGAKLNMSSYYLANKLCEKASLGDVDSIRRYVDYGGVDVNLTNYDKRTALHLAVCEEHVEVVKFLLSRNANILAVDRMGKTPLDYSKECKNVEISRLLKEHYEKYYNKQ